MPYKERGRKDPRHKNCHSPYKNKNFKQELFCKPHLSTPLRNNYKNQHLNNFLREELAKLDKPRGISGTNGQKRKIVCSKVIKLARQKHINDQQMSRLHETLAQAWLNIQGSLFPWLAEELGPLTEKQQELVATLELVRIEEFIYSARGFPGRPPKDRTAIARALVAKMVYNYATTRALLDRLATDRALRRICGWERKSEVPDEWTFSRAFAEFANSRLPERVHEALIQKSYQGELVGHISRDSTAIEAREKPVNKPASAKVPAQRGRPKTGERP
jgi:hypothetical protein